VTVNSPQITTNPPQINHQKTTLYHRLFAKTPAKRRQLAFGKNTRVKFQPC
jgi:hypothetical protein